MQSNGKSSIFSKEFSFNIYLLFNAVIAYFKRKYKNSKYRDMNLMQIVMTEFDSNSFMKSDLKNINKENHQYWIIEKIGHFSFIVSKNQNDRDICRRKIFS
ncbi:hypothetical protein DERP_000529 [Dermatophagoides pteronyssinus]|uniref:Uncharacterized protein n=1 Tax=Dermatophagoides pteronyssinus TaxID=6956 RepID=A0ABQ8J0E4_DERPT|nr:hypothetical protein DERP_000529 [Dermatophagoides pteronyssinus]